MAVGLARIVTQKLFSAMRLPRTQSKYAGCPGRAIVPVAFHWLCESREEMHKSVFANTHEGESQTTTLKRV